MKHQKIARSSRAGYIARWMTEPQPNVPHRAAHDAHVTPNSRLGLVIFIVYLTLYLGFMGIAAFKYQWFSTIVFGGVNLAIAYGMGLIVAALVLAIVYMAMCKRE